MYLALRQSTPAEPTPLICPNKAIHPNAHESILIANVPHSRNKMHPERAEHTSMNVVILLIRGILFRHLLYLLDGIAHLFNCSRGFAENTTGL